MDIRIFDTEDELAREGAKYIAAAARQAIAARGVALLAFSGGGTPVPMFRALAREALAWHAVHVFQVDERMVPAGDPDRNFAHLNEALLAHVPLPAAHIHPMPVEDQDIEAAARHYEAELAGLTGSTGALDLVQLGIGADGHTASLVPDDAVLEAADRAVAVTGPYQGHRRMTLTFPALNAARARLWLVAGAGKEDALRRLERGEHAIPAGRIARRASLVLADRAAAGDRLQA